MSNEKMREEFLAAFVAQFGFGRMAASSNADAAGMLACAEWAWFASRAAIEVELPAAYPDSSDPLYEVAYAQKCRETLESLGLRIKP
jgi:hypothetical protein